MPIDMSLSTGRWDLIAYKQSIPYLARYLSTILANIGRSDRRVATAQYIEGLLLPGRRKFIRPLAERLNVDPQSLQQAITHSPWDHQQVWSTIRSEILPLFEPLGLWIIHERGWLKQGTSSAGVSNQRCGGNGKKAHCQLSLELLFSDGAIAVPAAARLYLPADWGSNQERRQAAEIPDSIGFVSKCDLGIELIQEAMQDCATPGIVVADTVYGNDPEFKATLMRLGLEYFLEIDPAKTIPWNAAADLPPAQPCSIDQIIAGLDIAEWQNCSWLTAEAGMRRTRIAIREIFLDSTFGMGHGTLERSWLVVDWPSEQPQPYRCYLAHFHGRPDVARCLRLSRHRSYAGQYQRCFEDDLDLACYQGRTWKGFHHHMVLAAAAYLFVLMVDLRRRRPFWPDLRDDIPVDSAIAGETARFTSVLFRSGIPNLKSVLTVPSQSRTVTAALGD